MYLSNIGGVFMIEQQQKLMLSPYMEIYELVIPKDNLLRQIKELVDFSFIYDELLANYCLDTDSLCCQHPSCLFTDVDCCISISVHLISTRTAVNSFG